MAGLGFATAPQTSMQQSLTPTAPTLDPLGATLSAQPTVAPTTAPLIDAASNPLGAIGAVLQNFARGMKGQPLFTDELRQQRAEQQQIEMQRLGVGVEAMTKGMELLKNTPVQARAQTAHQYGQLFEHILPGFTDTLTKAAEQPEATEAQMRALGEHGEKLIAIAGSIDGALELAQKPDFMKYLDQNADKSNMDEIQKVFGRIQDLMGRSGAGKQILANLAADGFTVGDLQELVKNPELAGALGLEQRHINTLARSPEAQEALRPFGFTPSADLALAAKKKIEEKPLDRIAAEEAAKQSAAEAAKMINYVGKDGTIRREPQGKRNEMAALGFEPLVTGRTPDDTSEAEKRRLRAEGDRAGADEAPVNAYVAGVLGMDPKALPTVKEFRESGGNPELGDTTIKGLQEQEAAVKGAQDVIFRIQDAVEKTPDINAAAGKVAPFIQSQRANLRSLGKLVGANWVDDVDAEISKVAPTLDKYGIEGSTLRSLVLDLSYVAAISRGQQGNGLSNKDVDRFAKIVATNQGDPKALNAVLDEIAVRFDATFRDSFEASVRKRPPSSLPDVRTAESLADRIDAGEEITAEEVKALTPRARNELRLRLKRSGQ